MSAASIYRPRSAGICGGRRSNGTRTSVAAFRKRSLVQDPRIGASSAPRSFLWAAANVGSLTSWLQSTKHRFAWRSRPDPLTLSHHSAEPRRLRVSLFASTAVELASTAAQSNFAKSLKRRRLLNLPRFG